jgi:YceI-like domain
MLGPKVLDAEHYQEIIFRSNSAQPKGAGFWTVRGTLTLHGNARPVTVDVQEKDGCTTPVLANAPGSANNPTECLGRSPDVASLRHVRNEFQIAYRIPDRPGLIPHAAAGGNFIDGAFHVHAPVSSRLDETRLWTRGGHAFRERGQLLRTVGIHGEYLLYPLWV